MHSDLQLHRRRRRRRVNPIFMAILVTAAASFCIAAVWQHLTVSEEAVETFEFDPAVLRDFEGSLPEGVTPPAEESSPEEEAPSQEPAAEKPVFNFDGALPEQPERVTSAYFDDAVFIGDSISTGISLYDVMSNTTVYASTGVGIQNVLTSKFAEVDGVSMTVPDALKKSPPEKIYILLGANSLAGDLDAVSEKYADILDSIKECAPDALLYVQSVFPINEAIYAEKYRGTITNEIIRDFNQKLLDICKEKEIYYLDLYSYFCDESGGLSDEITADGLHIFSSQYLNWFDYLKTHAVQK